VRQARRIAVALTLAAAAAIVVAGPVFAGIGTSPT
jgi:hypothetical protein